MNRKIQICLYRIWQCTYGIIQSLLGFFLLLINIREKHYIFHGAVVTEWKHGSSVSLGMFLFVSTKYKRKAETAEHYNRLVAHEYGHTIQSLVLGPLYLIVIGLPSLLWASVPAFKKMRKKRQISYYSFYTESWANAWGKWTLEKSMPLEKGKIQDC